MAKPRGHVQLNGKDYIIVDGSYQSKMVPLFRPQLVVEGISHDALDQFLYWVQSTWNLVTQRIASLKFWRFGGYQAIDGLDNYEEGKLKLQPATSLCLSDTGNGGILFAFGSFLYLFKKDGTVQRTSGSCSWTAVTFDFNADAGTTTPPAASGTAAERTELGLGEVEPSPGSESTSSHSPGGVLPDR